MSFGSAFTVSSRDSIVLTWWPVCVAARWPEARSAAVATVSAAPKAAMNRRSADTASTLESLRPRSTIPSRSLISPGLQRSRLSQPYSTHFSKLIFISQQEHLLALQHSVQEVISVFNLRLELGNGVDRRVNETANLFLDIR